MKHLVITIILIIFLTNNMYSQSLEFIVTENCTAYDVSDKKDDIFEKGEILVYNKDDYFFYDQNTTYKMLITVSRPNTKHSYYTDLDCLALRNSIPKHTELENDIWIEKYNIDILLLPENQREKFINSKTSYWSDYKQEYLYDFGDPINEPWYNFYSPLDLNIDTYYMNFSAFPTFYSMDLLISNIEKESNKYTFTVFSKHLGNDNNVQFEFRDLYYKDSPYKLFLIQDGDYLDMYLGMIRPSKNVFSYIRGNQEMIEEIEHFVRREPYDPSKILWPRHANGTSDYDDKTILDHKTGNAYLTLHNSTIRTEPDSNSDIVTDIKKDDVVTILEKTNGVTINDIQSNWLKVKTDNNQTGWVFGGDISLNDATSREEQVQYEAEHAELLKVAQQYQEKLEQERKAEEEQKAIEQKAQALRDEEERLLQEAMDKLIDFDVFLNVTGGMLVFIILLIVVILILKSKKKNRKSK
ncbi:SH3 domain-containing protein [Spirochaeta cellobiosiphila]|uniref:SH3 domain-containing protein n=1 Tax=Spirochaeta cellobiosiphila TaxID=504483 RepID=UPI000414FA75|nr:SH3 domain-containing protein [Spirochaeta cellobiosiphila]